MIGSFYTQNYYAGKTFTVKHFMAMGASKAIIYRTIQRYEEGGNAQRKVGSGPTAVKLTPAKVNRLLNDAVGKKGVSQ